MQISLDISCRHAPLRLYAKQGDAATRFIEARFISGSGEFSLSQATHSELRVKKPDGTITVNEGDIGEESVLYPLSEQSLTAAGEGQADFILYGSGDEVLSCVPALLTVIESPVGDEAVVSESEYKAFVKEFNALESDLLEVAEEVAVLESDLTSFKNQYKTEKIGVDNAIRSLNSRLGGLTFTQTTAEAYAALNPPDPSTVYYVTDEKGNVTQYLGAVKLASGANTVGSATALADGTAEAVVGEAAEIVDTETEET